MNVQDVRDGFWKRVESLKAENIRTSGQVGFDEGLNEPRREPLEAPLGPTSGDDVTWLFDHAAELLGEYEGRWVAIVNRKVVSAGDGAVEVEAEALRLHPGSRPVIWLVEG